MEYYFLELVLVDALRLMVWWLFSLIYAGLVFIQIVILYIVIINPRAETSRLLT